MDKEKAEEVLVFDGPELDGTKFHGCAGGDGWENWCGVGQEMTLDGVYTLEQLEALVWWIKEHGENP